MDLWTLVQTSRQISQTSRRLEKIKYRPDKTPEQAGTLDTVRRLKI